LLKLTLFFCLLLHLLFSVFCPGTTVLPNGVVMVSGGANSATTSFYDYRSNQWSVGPDMVIPRGYQAHTLLANGEVFTFGGSWSGPNRDKDGEVWSPSSNSWRLLTGVPSAPAHTRDSGGRYRSDNHYWLFVSPNGRVRMEENKQHTVFLEMPLRLSLTSCCLEPDIPRRPQPANALDYNGRQRVAGAFRSTG
jgi:galactose oxidase